MLFGVVALGLALLVVPSAAQDAKKEGDKDSKGSIPAAKKALPIPDDQAKKIQAIDDERRVKLARLDRAIDMVDERNRRLLQLYMEFMRGLIGIESQIRQTEARLTAARAELKPVEQVKVPADMIEKFINNHPQVQKEQSEIGRLKDRISDYRGRFKHLRQMEQALQEAHADLETVKASVQPEVLQQLQKHLHRQRVGHVEEAKESLTALKDQHAAVLKQMNTLAAVEAWTALSAFQLQRERAELEKNDLKGSKEKDPDKK
jgi:hypothetical protein